MTYTILLRGHPWQTWSASHLHQSSSASLHFPACHLSASTACAMLRRYLLSFITSPMFSSCRGSEQGNMPPNFTEEPSVLLPLFAKSKQILMVPLAFWILCGRAIIYLSAFRSDFSPQGQDSAPVRGDRWHLVVRNLLIP